MHVPPLNSVDGAYWYLVGVILALALLSALYLAGVTAGFLPDIAQLF